MRKIVKAVVLTLLLISLVVCSIIMSPLLALSVFTESE